MNICSPFHFSFYIQNDDSRAGQNPAKFTVEFSRGAHYCVFKYCVAGRTGYGQLFFGGTLARGLFFNHTIGEHAQDVLNLLGSTHKRSAASHLMGGLRESRPWKTCSPIMFPQEIQAAR